MLPTKMPTTSPDVGSPQDEHVSESGGRREQAGDRAGEFVLLDHLIEHATNGLHAASVPVRG